MNSGADECALDAMQHGPHAYHCPNGHGPLHVRSDATSPSHLSLICDTCGHRVAADYALIGRALAGATTSPGPETRLADGSVPRGLRADGTVRTTGWAQIGDFPVSSGVWAALLPFLLAWPVSPLVAVLAAPIGYAVWKLCTAKLLPASRAVNAESTAVADLAAGQFVRLYGTAGPVGQVSSVDTHVLRLVGGAELGNDRVWRVELRD